MDKALQDQISVHWLHPQQRPPVYFIPATLTTSSPQHSQAFSHFRAWVVPLDRSTLPIHPSHLRWTITLSKKTSPNPTGGCCRPCLPQNPSFLCNSYHSPLSLVWLFKMHLSHWTEGSRRAGAPWNCSSLHPQCPSQVLTQSMHYSINVFWTNLLDHRKSKRIPEKHLPLLHWLH